MLTDKNHIKIFGEVVEKFNLSIYLSIYLRRYYTSKYYTKAYAHKLERMLSCVFVYNQY